MVKKIIGIYQITCMVNGKRYIGQSIDIKRRFASHKRKPPRQMAEDFNRYGVDAFKFEILEECSVEELDKKETYYIETFAPEYNIRKEGYTLPESAREKLRQDRLGKEFTPEHCKNISKGKLGKKIAALSVKVQCVETGKIFDSITAAAESCGAKQGNISKVLSGKRDFAGGYSWRYVENKACQEKADETRRKRKEAQTDKKPSDSFLKANYQAVQCVETGEIFDSLQKAASNCGVSGVTISMALRCSSTAGGFHWRYVGGKKRSYQTFPKAVRCIETGETFENIKSVAKKFKIYPETICRVLKGRQKTASGFHWEYVDENSPGKFHRNAKSVRCIETQEIFESISAAAKKFNVSNASISQVLHGRSKMSCGYHWEFATFTP